MSKYKDFVHSNAPEESPVEEKGVVGTYFKHLNTYLWIQGNPKARASMKNHPGVKIYKHTGALLFWLWMLILVLHSCATN